jgi:hypothetical protein
MKRKIRPLRPAAREQAAAFLASLSQSNLQPPISYDGFLNLQLTMLSSALEHLFSDFDYEANLDSHTAIAIRLVGLSAEQAMWVWEHGIPCSGPAN